MTKRYAAAFAAIATCLIFAAGASAASTVGATFAPGIPTLPEKLNFATSTATVNSNVVPADGIITSFSHVAEVSPDATLALALLRPANGGYIFVGASAPQTLASGVLNTFPTRMAAKAGDRIGVLGSTSALAAASSSANLMDIFVGSSEPLVAGQQLSILSPYNGYTIDIAAVVEPDADGDGFGDQSQDSCPSNGAVQSACVAPTVAYTYKKSQKTKSAIKFSLTSNLGATVKATAKIKVGKKSYKLKSKSVNVLANTATTVKLSLSSKIKNAIKDEGKGKLTVSVAATEVSGQTAKKTLKITVKP